MYVFVCKWHFWWHQIWRHIHVTMLKSWAKFSNVLIHWDIRMIRAKNYETVFKFAKVMPRIQVVSFFWTQCRHLKPEWWKTFMQNQWKKVLPIAQRQIALNNYVPVLNMPLIGVHISTTVNNNHRLLCRMAADKIRYIKRTQKYE